MFAAEVRHRAAGDRQASYCQPLKPSSAEALIGVEAARRRPSSLGGVLIGALEILAAPDLFGKPRIILQRLPSIAVGQPASFFHHGSDCCAASWPSRRAAISRADMATFVSRRASAMMVSERSRSRSKSAR